MHPDIQTSAPARVGFSRRYRQHKGIALVLVLWVLSLLTIMALSLTMSQRSQNALAQNQIDNARFRALADGAVQLAVLNLASDSAQALPVEDLWIPDGSPQIVSFGGDEIEIRIFNEASRIDLNQINPNQLATFLELAGVLDEQRDALVGAIIDWRDPDQFSNLNGAEDDTYQAEGYGYGAADQNFQSPEELLQVLGMNHDIFRSLEPDLRSLSSSAKASGPSRMMGGRSSSRGTESFKADFASARALAVMNNLNLEDAESLASERSQPTVPGAQGPRMRDRGGPDYRIRATARLGQAVSRSIEVVVRLSRGSSPSFEILWRREGLMAYPVSTD